MYKTSSVFEVFNQRLYYSFSSFVPIATPPLSPFFFVNVYLKRRIETISNKGGQDSLVHWSDGIGLVCLPFSTIVCCQSTELIWVFFLLIKFSILPPPPTTQVAHLEARLASEIASRERLIAEETEKVHAAAVVVLGLHFGSENTCKISKIFEDSSRYSVFFSNRSEVRWYFRFWTVYEFLKHIQYFRLFLCYRFLFVTV